MKKSIIKIITFCMVAFAVFWVCRIISVNKNANSNVVYKLGEEIDKGTVSLKATESFLLAKEEFEKKFETEIPDVYEGEYLILCVRFNFENKTDYDISWDELFAYTDMGFETVTWASMIDPLLGNKINVLKTETFEAGTTQEIWYATPVNKVCFKEKNWNNISDYEFFYVLSLSPNKETIALEIHN